MSSKSRDEYERELLLEGRWLPVTECVLFVRATVHEAVEELVGGVRGQYVSRQFGSPLRQRSVAGDSLDDLFTSLLPLEEPEARRSLFVQTLNPEWSAMFTSDYRGHDPQSPMSWFKQGNVETVSITDAPHDPNQPGFRASYGVRKIEMYEIRQPGDAVGRTLGVRAINRRQWEVAGGTGEFPVGNVWRPDAIRVSDRFTHEHLLQMAERFGLHPFDEDFYAPDRTGIIVERTDPVDGEQRLTTLAQARGEEPLEPVNPLAIGHA